MPNTTANFALPYPNSLDAPCDFAEQWCDFTDAVEAVLAGFQESVDRTYPVVPMAQLRQTEQTAYASDTNSVALDYDTVSFDTAGFVDFDASSNEITVDRAGVFLWLGNETAGPVGLNTIQAILVPVQVNPLLVTTQTNVLLDRNAQDIGNLGVGTEVYSTSTSRGMAFTVSAAPFAATIRHSHLTTLWHSDTRRPS